MDWSQLGSKIAGMGAKLLGEAIPIPGAGIAADAIADAFGTEKTPDAIEEAIRKNPESAAKLQKIELDHKAQLKEIATERKTEHEQEVTKRQQEVNDTIQVGYKQGVLWRRAVGWSFAIGIPLLFIAICGLIGYGIYINKVSAVADAVAVILQAIQPIIYAYLVILGVAGYQDGKLGQLMSGKKGNGMADIVKAVKGDK